MADEKRSCLLIAMPQLIDPNFFQTTTLLSAFTSEGAMGVILNRPLRITLKEVFANSSEIKTDVPVNVYWGGPVENNRGWIIHEDAGMAAQSMLIEDGLYLSSSNEVWKQMVEFKPQPDTPRYRFFLGYSGWGPGQLEREIAGSSWVTAPLRRDLIFDEAPKTLWTRTLASIGVDPVHLTAAPQTEVN